MAGERPTTSNSFEGLLPYAPHSTWRQLMEGLRKSSTSRIDKSYLRPYRLSQASRSVLLAALRFLHLVDQEGVPTEELKSLASSTGEDYQNRLKKQIERSYGPLLGDIDLATATPDLLLERFKTLGARGEVARKSLSLFVALAQEAGMQLSPHIRVRRRPPKGQSSTKGSPKVSSPARLQRSTSVARPSHPAVPEDADPSIATIVSDKFPAFDPMWDRETVERWRESFGELLRIALGTDRG